MPTKTNDKMQLWAALRGGLLVMTAYATVGCGNVREERADAGGGGGTPAFSLSAPADPVDIRQATSADVEVTIERMNGFEGEVTVTVSDPPLGVSADPITIPAGESTGSLAIAVAEGAGEGQAHSLSIEGTAGELADSAELDIFVVGVAGTLDDSYGDGGRQLIALPAEATITNMVRQADGKLVLGGTAGDAMIVVRMHEDGALDATFGTNGVATLDFAALGVPDVSRGSVAVQSDGKIVAAGSGDSDPDPAVFDFDIVLARLDASGNLDDTFAGGGKIVHPIGGDSATAVHMALGGDDRIVIVGTHRPSGGLNASDWFAARFTPDGALDSGFDGDGVRRDDGDFYDSTFQAVVRPNGGLAIRGHMMGSAAFSPVEPVLLSYQPDGTPDAGFGAGGKVVLDPIDGLVPATYDLLLQEDGALVAAGALGSAPAVFRFTVTGAFDPGWSDDGRAGIPLQTNESGRFGAALNTDDGLVAVGLTGPPDRLTLARFAEGGTLDPTFGDGGVLRHAHGLTSDSLTGAVVVDRSRVLVLVSAVDAQGDRHRYCFRAWL